MTAHTRSGLNSREVACVLQGGLSLTIDRPLLGRKALP